RREQLVLPFRRYTPPRVLDADGNPAASPIRRAPDPYPTARPVVFDRVRDQVQEHLNQALSIRPYETVPADERLLVHLYFALRRKRPNHAPRRVHRAPRSHRLQREILPARLDSSDLLNFIDQLEQMPARLQNVLYT